MESENNKKLSNSKQITFKLSAEEKKYLEQKAIKFNIPLSEFVRVKALDTDDQVFNLKTKVSELSKEVMLLKIKLDRFKDGESSPDNIVLPLTFPQRQVIELLLKDYNTNKVSLARNITSFILVMASRENSFLELSSGKKIKIEDVNDALEELKDEIRQACDETNQINKNT